VICVSYDIYLVDPVTSQTLELDTAHDLRGGTYAVGGTRDCWLNITYNYAHYYYEATDGDPRFAHDEVPAYYPDGTTGPVETEYGIRGLYGKTGAESIPMLTDMIRRIEEKYKENGEWIETVRHRREYRDSDTGQKLTFVDILRRPATDYFINEYDEMISEGPNDDYWEDTAANAISPLYKLLAMAMLRPDGVWSGD